MFLDGDKIELHDNCVLIIPPFKRQERHVQMEKLDYTFLIFQEEFVYNFISDKYFMYRLLYCYQSDVGEKYPSTHSGKRLCLDDGHQQDCP